MRRILFAVVGLSISAAFCMVAMPLDGKRLGAEVSGNYITGVVMDKKKNPISDASIKISQAGKELLTVYTSQDGTYKTDKLKPGKYSLEVRKDGYAVKKVKVKVKKKKPAKIDFRLKKEVVKEKKEQHGYITGIVIDEKKNPISDASIKISQAGKELLTVYTSQDGTYKTDKLKLGKYSFKARKDGYAAAEVEIKVKKKEFLKVDFCLEKETVKVEEKKYNYIEGIVMDEEKNPIFDAGIKISQDDKELLRVYTYRNGTYQSGILKPGKYNLKTWKEGYIPEGMDVEVTEEKPIEIDFQLKREKYNYASGIVTDIEKNPIFDAGIKISREGTELLRVYTYKNGTYKSDFLKPGKYNLKVWKEGYMPEDVDIEITEEEPANVDFQLIEELK